MPIRKAIAINIFLPAVLEGGGILAACKVAAKFTGFSDEVIRRWAKDTFCDYFGMVVNIDDVDDESIEEELEIQLESQRGSTRRRDHC